MKATLLLITVVVAALAIAPVATAVDRAGGPGAGGPVLIPNELDGHAFVGGPGAGGPELIPNELDGHAFVGGPGAAGPVLATTPRGTTDGPGSSILGLAIVLAAGAALIAVGETARRRRGAAAQPSH